MVKTWPLSPIGYIYNGGKISCKNSDINCYRLHCSSPPFGLSLLFLYTSLSIFFCPNVSTRRSFPFLRDGSSRALSCSPSSAATPPSSASDIDNSSPSSSSSRALFLPLFPVPPLPPPILTFTRGGTENPNAFPTFARSSALTSNIFFSEYDA
jgi:hypothetical protein